MDFKISHSLPGRVRLRYERHILSLRQAMLVQMLVGLQEAIVSISVNTVSGSILIEYKDTSLETVLSYVKALERFCSFCAGKSFGVVAVPYS